MSLLGFSGRGVKHEQQTRHSTVSSQGSQQLQHERHRLAAEHHRGGSRGRIRAGLLRMSRVVASVLAMAFVVVTLWVLGVI